MFGHHPYPRSRLQVPLWFRVLAFPLLCIAALALLAYSAAALALLSIALGLDRLGEAWKL